MTFHNDYNTVDQMKKKSEMNNQIKKNESIKKMNMIKKFNFISINTEIIKIQQSSIITIVIELKKSEIFIYSNKRFSKQKTLKLINNNVIHKWCIIIIIIIIW